MRERGPLRKDLISQNFGNAKVIFSKLSVQMRHKQLSIKPTSLNLLTNQLMTQRVACPTTDFKSLGIIRMHPKMHWDTLRREIPENMPLPRHGDLWQ